MQTQIKDYIKNSTSQLSMKNYTYIDFSPQSFAYNEKLETVVLLNPLLQVEFVTPSNQKLTYVPPELVQNDGQQWTSKSDTFALGQLLYELKFGHKLDTSQDAGSLEQLRTQLSQRLNSQLQNE
jgi:hypothetical protein